MFRKTKIRLVSLYTLVFFFILTFLCVFLYFYMYRITYKNIDDRLTTEAVEHKQGVESPSENKRESERKIIYLFWDKNGNFISSYPQKEFYKKEIEFLSPKEQDVRLRTQAIQAHTYRILTVKSNEVTIGKTHNMRVKTIELVYNIDPEVAMLNNLLVIICVGIGASLILSYLVGLFLASRVLVSIQRSWEKQSQFAADASHELRTPLSVIRTHLELLFRHPSKTIEQESLSIYKSLSEVDRMTKLVEDLLTLARTDSNDQLINPSTFFIDELLTLIVQQFEPIAETKDILLTGKIEGNIMYYGDKERLHQLFVILLDNALKFTPLEGKVTLFCRKEGNSLKISIEDTGVGIPSKDLPRVFDRFYRSDKNRERKTGGTGLGLSIAKWIVEVHEGTIKIESKENEGTKILIKLPIKDHF